MKQPKKKQVRMTEIFRQLGLDTAAYSGIATKKIKKETCDWALAIDFKN